MALRYERLRTGVCWWCVVLSLAAARAFAEPEPTGGNRYQVNVELFSSAPGDAGSGADRYRYEGSGSTGSGGTLGLSVGQSSVTIVHKKQAGCHVEVRVEPGRPDSPSESPSRRLDLSDLKPVSLRFGPEATGGRSLILNLSPSVRRVEPPRPLDHDALGVTRWAFNKSSVIVDGWRYAGEMNMAGGELGYVDVAGLAKVEFSLKPFEGAEPTGVFQDGTLRLPQEGPGSRGHTVEIRHVRTGSPVRLDLGSRPYRVWVRWSRPSQSVEEAIAEVLAFDVDEYMEALEPEAAERQEILERTRRTREQLRAVDPADLSYDGPLAGAWNAIGLRAGMGAVSKRDRVEPPPSGR